jgi:hypothetical protein
MVAAECASKQHTHGKAGEQRHEAYTFIEAVVAEGYPGYEIYGVFAGKRELHHLGFNSLFTVKDLEQLRRNDKLPERAVLVFMDIYHMEPSLLRACAGHPMIFYRRNPSTVSGGTDCTSFSLSRGPNGDMLRERVNGGAEYVHPVMNIPHDLAIVAASRGSMFNYLLFKLGVNGAPYEHKRANWPWILRLWTGLAPSCYIYDVIHKPLEFGSTEIVLMHPKITVNTPWWLLKRTLERGEINGLGRMLVRQEDSVRVYHTEAGEVKVLYVDGIRPYISMTYARPCAAHHEISIAAFQAMTIHHGLHKSMTYGTATAHRKLTLLMRDPDYTHVAPLDKTQQASQEASLLVLALMNCTGFDLGITSYIRDTEEIELAAQKGALIRYGPDVSPDNGGPSNAATAPLMTKEELERSVKQRLTLSKTTGNKLPKEAWLWIDEFIVKLGKIRTERIGTKRKDGSLVEPAKERHRIDKENSTIVNVIVDRGFELDELVTTQEELLAKDPSKAKQVVLLNNGAVMPKPKASQKNEGMMGAADKDKPGRVICDTGYAHNAPLSRVVNPLTRLMKNVFKKAWSPGQTPSEQANNVHELCMRAEELGLVVQSCDLSAADSRAACFRPAIHKLIITLVQGTPAQQKECKRIIDTELNMKLSTAGRRDIDDLGYEPSYFTSGGINMSGSQITTFFNTTIQLFLAFCAARADGLEISEAWAQLGLAYGDDNVTLRADTYMEVATRCHQVVKCEKRLTNDEPLEYVSRLYIDPLTKASSIPNMARALSKIGVSARKCPDDPVSVLRHRVEGYATANRNAPILMEYCEAVARLYEFKLTDYRVSDDLTSWDRDMRWKRTKGPYPLDDSDRAQAVYVAADNLGVDTVTVSKLIEKLKAVKTLTDLQGLASKVHPELPDELFGVQINGLETGSANSQETKNPLADAPEF